MKSGAAAHIVASVVDVIASGAEEERRARGLDDGEYYGREGEREIQREPCFFLKKNHSTFLSLLSLSLYLFQAMSFSLPVLWRPGFEETAGIVSLSPTVYSPIKSRKRAEERKRSRKRLRKRERGKKERGE